MYIFWHTFFVSRLHLILWRWGEFHTINKQITHTHTRTHARTHTHTECKLFGDVLRLLWIRLEDNILLEFWGLTIRERMCEKMEWGKVMVLNDRKSGCVMEERERYVWIHMHVIWFHLLLPIMHCNFNISKRFEGSFLTALQKCSKVFI